MSRITGKDAANLIEAYNSLYAPQEEVELTEEQVQEDFENWVNSLVEEGHDLSEYTWEEMYEAYVNEDLIGDLRANAGKAVSAVRSGVSAANRAAGAVNQAMVNRIRQNVPQGSFPGTRQTAQNTAMYGRYQQPASQQYGNQSRFSGARDAAFAKARQIQGSPVVGPRTAAPAPAAKPAAPVVTQRPAGGTPSYAGATGVKPVGTSVAGTFKPVAGAPSQASTFSAPAKPVNSQMAGMPTGVTTPAAPKPQLSARAQALKAGGPQGGARERMLNQDLDLFDIVKGYLIDEGYAESEEAAAVIMANMSDEWREEILDEEVRGAKKGTIRSVIEKGGKSIKYVQSGGDIVTGDRAAAERASAADRKRSGRNRANAARAEQARKKSIQNLNAKSGEDSGDYDSGHYGDDDTSDGKRHYSLSHTNRDARRRRASDR